MINDAARAACKASGFDLPILRTKADSAALYAALRAALTERHNGVETIK
jgi:hypothetical protein